MSLHLAVLVFPGPHDAADVFAAVRRRVGDRPWTRAAALIERGGDDRVLVRGTYGGHDLDGADIDLAAAGVRPDDGLMSAILGSCLGPSGRMAAVLAGDEVITESQSQAAPRELQGPYLEELRAALVPRSSAIVLLGPPVVVDELVASFHGEGARLLRRHLSPQAERALHSAAVSLGA